MDEACEVKSKPDKIDCNQSITTSGLAKSYLTISQHSQDWLTQRKRRDSAILRATQARSRKKTNKYEDNGLADNAPLNYLERKTKL